MKFAELRYRDCGWCRTSQVAMNVEWSSWDVRDAAGAQHSWAALSCPRCGRLTLIEVGNPAPLTGVPNIHDGTEVNEMGWMPRADDFGMNVAHLPDDIRGFFESAQRALIAGLPDAAAVQLRKTMEGAAAHKGVEERTLVRAVTKMMEQNLLTEDFRGLMTYVRQIGNIGAHYSSQTLSAEQVERAMRFTTQVLRNLFEVPGELAELEAQSDPEDASELMTTEPET